MLERIFCLVIFAVGAVGMTVSSSIFTKGIRAVRKDMFIYYTNLSNLAVVIYHVVLFVSSFYRESTVYGFISAPVLRLSVTLMILMTFVIYNFILWPSEFKRRFNAKKTGRSTDFKKRTVGESIANICVHYIVPLLTLLEWFCVAKKDSLKVSDGAIWVICPVIYVVFIMLRAKIGEKLKKSTLTWKKYPYFFIDVDKIGALKTTVNIVMIGVVSVAFGMAFVFITAR